MRVRKRGEIYEAYEFTGKEWSQDVTPFSPLAKVAGPPCMRCKRPMTDHGEVRTGYSYVVVCPGEWLVINSKTGKHEVMPKKQFEEEYERINAEIGSA